VEFQRLRIAPSMAPSGAAWRVAIVPGSHISCRHGAIDTGFRGAPRYTSASGDRYFGWTDAESGTARESA